MHEQGSSRWLAMISAMILEYGMNGWFSKDTSSQMNMTLTLLSVRLEKNMIDNMVFNHTEN
jgi:hypothetical protein